MTNRKYGYARVSSNDQNITPQIEAIEKSGVLTVFSEKVSGSSMKDRKQLEIVLDVLQKGDTLVITRLDRLARSVFDLQKIAIDLKDRGIFLIVLDQHVDTSHAAGKMFFDMLGVFAEFELNIRKERQLVGIAAAKKAGKYKGRVPTAQKKATEIIELKSQGKRVSEIVKTLDVSRASIYRILRENDVTLPI